jgi:hypothetical protein
MTYIEAFDRGRVRRALQVAHEIATDELMSEELEDMYPPNLQFIASALEAVTNESHRDLPVVANRFNEMDLAVLEDVWNKVLAVLTVSGTPRSIISDEIILSQPELTRLEDERAELQRKHSYTLERIDAINRRIEGSGTAKLIEAGTHYQNETGFHPKHDPFGGPHYEPTLGAQPGDP